MATTTQIKDLQSQTKLPLTIFQTAGALLPNIVIRTPHKGYVQIPLKEEHRPLLFGSVTQTDVHLSDVLDKIHKIEAEAVDYLITKWLESK